MHVEVAQKEHLFSSIDAFVHQARAAGVPVEYHTVDNMAHDFAVFCKTKAPAVVDARKRIVASVGRFLLQAEEQQRELLAVRMPCQTPPVSTQPTKYVAPRTTSTV